MTSTSINHAHRARRTNSQRTRAHRFQFAPLLAILPTSNDERAAKLRTSWATLRRYEAEGLDTYQADRCAVRAGYHPANVWPDWWSAEEGADQ